MKRFNKYYIWFVVLSIINIALIFIIPPDKSSLAKYNLTVNNAKLISLTVFIPLIFIWFAAFYGFIQFMQYAELIKKAKEGKALAIVARGLMYLAIGQPLLSIIQSLLNYWASLQPHWIAASVIINNYAALAVVLLAFYVIHQGASHLITVLKKELRYTPRERLMFVTFAVVSIFYCYVTLANPARQFPTPGIARAAYYLPDWLLVVSIVIPYLFVWFFGLRAAFYLRLYRRRIGGILYKQAIGYLSLGIVGVILSSMGIRFLTSLTTLLNSLTIKILLAVVYLLVVAISVGFILIAIGARKLKRIEEA